MRILVAVTCAAVLAAVAYYFVQSIQSNRAAAAETARAELAKLTVACSYLKDPGTLDGERAQLRGILRPKCAAIGIYF